MPKPTPDFDTAELEIQSLLAGRTAVCPPLHVLLALEQDALPAEFAGPARAHLEQCPLCTMLLEDMASLPEPEFSTGQQERIAASLPTQNSSSSFSSMTKSLLALAAALIVMAGLFFWKGRTHNSEVARFEPSQVPSPLQVKELPFAPLASPAASAALLTRGNGSHSEPSNEQLLPAFRAYNRADYGVAAKEFGALSVKFPENGMILLYLGVSQLALHQDGQADITLRRAHDARTPYDADAVQWYSVVAASRVHSAEARHLLQELCQKKASAYSARSCEALR